MKNTIYIIAIACIFASCSANKNMITVSNADLTEKEKVLIENNTCYSTASIVGGGAELAKEEKEKALKEKIKDRERKLKSIPDLKISNTENGFKATAQNDILFQFDSHELNDNAKEILSKLADIIKGIPDTKVEIIGHTDNIGEKQYNMILSKNRAAAVGNYLRQAGVDNNTITEDGKGFSQPVADNKTEDGRAKNRRVEIYITNTPVD